MTRTKAQTIIKNLTAYKAQHNLTAGERAKVNARIAELRPMAGWK